MIATLGTSACASQPRNQPPQQQQLAQAVSPPARLQPPERLSGMALSLLRSRMEFHARDMRGLVSEIMLLRYDEIQQGARRIAADANLSRPLANDATELNSSLPEKFFLYQESLRVEAKILADAASRQQAFEVADSYGRLSQVCVGCHATYRAGR